MATVVDLFIGAGGFSRGFQDVGFDVVLGVDIDLDAVTTASWNLRNAIVLRRDVAEVKGVELARLAGDVDVVIGSPPCEPFTRANPRRMQDPIDRLYTDPLGQLTLHFIRLVGELRPVVYVMENVPEIAREPLASAIRREFQRVGYEAYFNILRAEDYGTPSVRKRVFVSNLRLRPARWGRITVGRALADLPPPDTGYPNHETVSISWRKELKVSRLRQGESLLRFRGADRLYENLIRLNPHELAPTVMGSRRFVHPYENRLLTVREQARLMGFPDDHIFFGSKDKQFNLVGEAVPPPLARAIALEVLKKLRGST